MRALDTVDEADFLALERGHVDDVKVLKKGDIYIGRGSRQLGLEPSRWATHSEFAIRMYADHLAKDVLLRAEVKHLRVKRLLCHCRPAQGCHGDVLIAEFRRQFLRASVVGDTEELPLKW